MDEAATIIQTNFRSHQDRENMKFIARKGPFILRKFERYDGSYITMAARQNEDRILQSVQVIIHNEHGKQGFKVDMAAANILATDESIYECENLISKELYDQPLIESVEKAVRSNLQNMKQPREDIHEIEMQENSV